MLKPKSMLCVAAMGCAVVFFLDAKVQAAGDRMLKKQVSETIAKVRTGETSTARTDAAEHLFDLTWTGHHKVGDKAIADIASLLDVSDDSVRYWVARSLGNFGQRAKAFAPRLQALLAEVDCLQGSKTSASGIRLALEQMGVPPPPRKCGNQD
jgi:hypothetical protein